MTDTRRNVAGRPCRCRRALGRIFLLVALAGTLIGLAGPLMLPEDGSHGEPRTQGGVWTQDMKNSDAFQGW